MVDDLVQATYLKLWEGGRNLLREFAFERPDAILGYLKKTAVNATHDYFKHGHSQSSGGTHSMFRPSTSNPRLDRTLREARRESPLKSFCGDR